MKFRNTAIFLALGLCAALLTGCGGEEKTSSVSEDIAATQESAIEGVVQGKHHITVETVEISAADLKAQDYTVPVYIRLDKNAGITYSEWGAQIDDRCTFSVDDEADDLAMTVYFAENAEEHFLWTAWASGGGVNDRTGNILRVLVKLPMNAAAGDFYTVDYADWSLADKGHAWSCNDSDWAESGDVTWTDGGVRVIE